MRKWIAGAILTMGLLVACGSHSGPTEADLVLEFAQCLADPDSALHEVAGSPSVERALLMVQHDMDSGKHSRADLERSLEMFCAE